MKVLFCSPFSSEEGVVKGGINTWGRHIMSYYREYAIDDVNLIPISFDRSTLVSESISIMSRVLEGVREQSNPIKMAICKMDVDKPDVTHICTSAGYGLFRDLLLVKAAKARNIKTVVHCHFGRIPELVKLKNWEWKLLSKVLRMCDVAIVMNKSSETTLLAEGFTNVAYLPNPLGMNIIEQIAKKRDAQKRISRNLLYVGHLYRTKGVFELVEGCSRIPNIKLRLVGKYLPQMKYFLENIATRTGNSSWLTFVGELPHNEVIEELQKADMFVFPSYSEGFPNVILEAMACGCPIVSSNVGAIPEMLDIDGDACGMCFVPQKADEVYNAVKCLIDNEQLKREYAAKAQKRVYSLYAMPKVWKQIVDIWRHAL